MFRNAFGEAPVPAPWPAYAAFGTSGRHLSSWNPVNPRPTYRPAVLYCTVVCLLPSSIHFIPHSHSSFSHFFFRTWISSQLAFSAFTLSGLTWASLVKRSMQLDQWTTLAVSGAPLYSSFYTCSASNSEVSETPEFWVSLTVLLLFHIL